MSAACARRQGAGRDDRRACRASRGRAAPRARCDLRGRQPLDLDLARTRSGDAELDRRAIGEVDDPAVLERTAVVDANDHAAAIALTRDAHVARDRQRRMRRRHREHVVDFAARGAVAVELAPVPRGGPLLPEGHVGGQRGVAAAKHGIGTVGARMQRLDARHGIRGIGEICRRAVGRPVVLVVHAALRRRAAACEQRRAQDQGQATVESPQEGARRGCRAGAHDCTSLRLAAIAISSPHAMPSVTSAVPP